MFILRGRSHSHVSDRDGNLANPSQKRGNQSLANLPLGSSEVAFLLAVALGKSAEEVGLKAMKRDGDFRYWRAGGRVLHVPMLRLDDIILGSL